MFDLDIDDSELNLNKDDDTDLDISKESNESTDDKPKKSVRGGRPNGRPAVRGGAKQGQTPNDKKMIYGIVGGVVVFSLVAGGFMFSSNSKAKKELQAQQEQMKLQQQQLAENNNQQSNVSTGIPSLYGDGKDINTSGLTSSDEILKDLNGNKVDANYTIRQQKTVTDYINYVKHRATTGDGMEFYWLEATYKKQPYKVQVPYSIYSKLDDEGITVVDAEILVLEGGGEIVSYMSVRKDAKALLEQ